MPRTKRTGEASLTVRLPEELLAEIKVLADADTRSLNGEIVVLLKEAVARWKK